MLLHYFWKLKIQIFCRCGRNRKQIAFLIASDFFIHKFSHFRCQNSKSFPILITNKIFHVTVILLFFNFAINSWHRKFVTAVVTAVFVNNQHGIQRRRQDFGKKFVFEGVHSKEVDRRISWEKLDKAWC